MGFPVYRSVFCNICEDKSEHINHLIICNSGKQNPIFKTIKDRRAHRACSVDPQFVQLNGKDTQRPKNVLQNFFKKIDIEKMTGSLP